MLLSLFAKIQTKVHQNSPHTLRPPASCRGMPGMPGASGFLGARGAPGAPGQQLTQLPAGAGATPITDASEEPLEVELRDALGNVCAAAGGAVSACVVSADGDDLGQGSVLPRFEARGRKILGFTSTNLLGFLRFLTRSY